MSIRSSIRRAVPRAARPGVFIQKITTVKTSGRVWSGPFSGMKYLDEAIGSAITPKLLGIYERELHEAISEVLKCQTGTVINIGAGEGYYAVGVARAIPDCRVVAFETDETGRTMISKLAKLNNCGSSVEVRGTCDPLSLQTVLSSVSDFPVTVICYVEGYEATLMDPILIPGLRDATIIVEMHEFAVRGITELIRMRFKASHRIENIRTVPRTASEYPFRTGVMRICPSKIVVRAIGEGRPEEMNWLWLRPLNPSEGVGAVER